MTSFWTQYIQSSWLFQNAITMTPAKYINIIAWVVYWFAFMVMKRDKAVKNIPFDPRSKEPLVWMIIIEFIINTLFWVDVGSITNEAIRSSFYPLSFTVGLILLIAGLMFSVVAWKYAGPGRSFLTRVSRDHLFSTSGPYSSMRHPIYSGLIIMWFGASFLFFNWFGILSGIAVFIPLMRYRAKIEEEDLQKTFGVDYERYRKTTWSFVPKLF